jgi:hypothetical protein
MIQRQRKKKKEKVLVSFGFGVRKSGCVLKREMGVSVYRSKRESVCVKSRDRDSYRQNVCVCGRYKEKVTTQETDTDTERINKVER